MHMYENTICVLLFIDLNVGLFYFVLIASLIPSGGGSLKCCRIILLPLWIAMIAVGEYLSSVCTVCMCMVHVPCVTVLYDIVLCALYACTVCTVCTVCILYTVCILCACTVCTICTVYTIVVMM